MEHLETDGTAIDWDTECLAVEAADWALSSLVAVVLGVLLGAVLVLLAMCR